MRIRINKAFIWTSGGVRYWIVEFGEGFIGGVVLESEPVFDDFD